MELNGLLGGFEEIQGGLRAATFKPKSREQGLGVIGICSGTGSDFWHGESPFVVEASFKKKGKMKLFIALFQMMSYWITFMVQPPPPILKLSFISLNLTSLTSSFKNACWKILISDSPSCFCIHIFLEMANRAQIKNPVYISRAGSKPSSYNIPQANLSALPQTILVAGLWDESACI